MKPFFVLLLLLTFLTDSYGQSHDKQVRMKVDSMLLVRYNKIKYDTAYIKRPDKYFTLRLRANVTGNKIKIEGKSDGLSTSSELSTDNKFAMSIGASYKGIGGCFSINPAGIFGRSRDYEFNFNYYTNLLSLDLSYQKAESLNGDLYHGEQNTTLERGDIDMAAWNVTVCYAFNRRRFSYPAAFTQTFIQRKSAGSWLAGVSFQRMDIFHAGERDPLIPEFRILANNFAVGGGYGYNYILAKKWLLHITAMPTLIVAKHSHITVSGEKSKIGFYFPEMIFNHRLSVTYNINPQFFVSVMSVINLTVYKSSEMFITQNKWLSRATIGVRF